MADTYVANPLSLLVRAATVVAGDFVPVLRTSAPLAKDKNVLVPAAAFGGAGGGPGFGGFQRESITAWPFTSAFVLPPAAVLAIIVSGSVNLPGIDFTLTADATGHPVCTPIGAAPSPTTYGITLITGLTSTTAAGTAPTSATY